MTFKIIVASYNSHNEVQGCLESIRTQVFEDYEVTVVDDCSPDIRQPEFINGWTGAMDGRWRSILHTENRGALYSQVEAINSMNCDDTDVIVFLDGDDKFSDAATLNIVDDYYHGPGSPLMTYGSYRSVPYAPTCPPVQHYPRECVANNDYRNAGKWGLRFNHLRTMKYEVFKHLTTEDFLDADGSWYHVAGDTAVMIPCLELAGPRHTMIPEILVDYTSNSDQADWRLYAPEIDRIHKRIFASPRKEML